jgi:hypothetical protein
MKGAKFLLTMKSKPRKRFTAEEDDLIRERVERHGDPHFAPWSEIAAHVPGRTPRQVRERFQHYLGPHVSTEPWTSDEDDLLCRLHDQLGSNWAAIATRLPGRTNAAVKNRWNTAFKKKDLPKPPDTDETPDATTFDDFDDQSWFDVLLTPYEDAWTPPL